MIEQNEAVTSGQFWTAEPPGADAEQEVSIEQSIHERFAINVGDRMRFDVVGPHLRGEGDERAPRAMGGLRGAAASCSCFAPARSRGRRTRSSGSFAARAAADARARLQYDIVSKYPNVSAIDARDVIARIQEVVDNIVLAISIVGGIALASGVLILVGAVAMTKFQRVYEAAMLRTLGASTRLLMTMVALEYSALGLLAGLIGARGALALSWAVTKYLFQIAWRPQPGLLVAGALLTTALVAIVGVLASAKSSARSRWGAARGVSARIACPRGADPAAHHPTGRGSRGSRRRRGHVVALTVTYVGHVDLDPDACDAAVRQASRVRRSD